MHGKSSGNTQIIYSTTLASFLFMYTETYEWAIYEVDNISNLPEEAKTTTKKTTI